MGMVINFGKRFGKYVTSWAKRVWGVIKRIGRGFKALGKVLVSPFTGK